MINFRAQRTMTKCVIPDNIGLSTTDFTNAFRSTKLQTVKISNKITNMSYIFSACSALACSPVCGPNVTNMRGAYSQCRNLTGSPVCGHNVTDMS